MTTSAWVFMLAIWSVIISFTLYCFWKLLGSPRKLDGD